MTGIVHGIMNTLIINIAMEMKEDLYYTEKNSFYLIIIFQVVLFIEPGKISGRNTRIYLELYRIVQNRKTLIYTRILSVLLN